MMKTCKQLLIAVLLISFITAGTVSVFASANEKTLQQKAEALDALKIITGTNGDYRLADQLKRCEAATYIVRLMGKTKYVDDNNKLFSVTSFSDVPSNQWYAKYIGFLSSNGLIPNNTKKFNPLEKITNKDFIRLVLTALDYKEGVDFNSDKASIFTKAKDIGLVSLAYCIQQVDKEIFTTKSSAVEVMFTALQLKCKSGDKILSQKLIDEGVTTRRQLAALGFAEDKPVSEIIKISTLDQNKIEIKFNENIAFVQSIKIYPKDNPNDVMFTTIQSLSGDTLIASTSSIDATKEYMVELKGVEDEKENVRDVAKSFKGFEAIEVNSSYFRIKKIEPVNERSIKVHFTHPVTLNSEVCLYYSIVRDNTVVADGRLGAIKAGTLNSDKNAVLLSLSSNLLSPNGVYTLNINGNMVSAYGAKINNGTGDSMKFIAVGGTASKFMLNQVVAIDKKTLYLSFNKEVNPFLAQQVFNFYLTDDNNNPIRILSSSVNQSGDGVQLTTEQELIKDRKYNVVINNLNDVTKQEYITEQKYQFQADYGRMDAFNVTGINVIDDQTIEIYFNKPLNPATAVISSYYSIGRRGSYSGISPEKALYDPNSNPNMVKLYLSKSNCLNNQSNYEIRIYSGMKDSYGNSISVTGIGFSGTSQKRTDIRIESIAPVSSDSVKVTFSREISFDASNLLPSNFVLEYAYNGIFIKKIPAAVIYVDARTVVLKFDVLDLNTSYSLKIMSLLDYTGGTNKALESSFELK